MHPRPLIVHFGAGNIGRSLVGTLFSRAGYEILFVDAAPDIVAALRQRHGYRVVVKDDLPPGAPAVLEVRGADAIDARDGEAVAGAVKAVADVHLAAGRFPEALDAYALFIASFTGNALEASARRGQGLALTGLQRHGEAANAFRAAADLSPDALAVAEINRQHYGLQTRLHRTTCRRRRRPAS